MATLPPQATASRTCPDRHNCPRRKERQENLEPLADRDGKSVPVEAGCDYLDAKPAQRRAIQKSCLGEKDARFVVKILSDVSLAAPVDGPKKKGNRLLLKRQPVEG